MRRSDEPFEPDRIRWFGDPWPSEEHRAPVCDDDRYAIQTPRGASCVLCDEEIVLGQRGIRYAYNTGYAHAECNLRAVTGNLRHINGECHHVGECNEKSTQTYHEEALDVWRSYGLPLP